MHTRTHTPAHTHNTHTPARKHTHAHTHTHTHEQLDVTGKHQNATTAKPTDRRPPMNDQAPGGFCRMQGSGGAYARITAYNASTLVYEHVVNNGGAVLDTWTVTQSHHGPFFGQYW
jgi:hypothetical protein